MTPTEQKRFIYINFTMSQINSCADDIYEALADNEPEKAAESAEKMKSMCNEIISDASISPKTE